MAELARNLNDTELDVPSFDPDPDRDALAEPVVEPEERVLARHVIVRAGASHASSCRDTHRSELMEGAGLTCRTQDGTWHHEQSEILARVRVVGAESNKDLR
jgi:hypothetical protein